MKEKFILLLKGFAIGIGKIIPGVSGAIVAITLNVYEPVLNAISNIRYGFYEKMKYLANLGVGIVLAIVLGSNVVIYLLEHYYLYTICLFLGMMISGTVSVFKEVRELSLSDKIFSFIIIGIIVYISVCPLDVQIIKLESSAFSFILYFISGILDAFCSIVPGISGTAVLMLVGTYNTILKALGGMMTLSGVFNNFVIIAPFFLGIVVGGYFISRMVNYFFKKYRKKMYCCILGFSFFSMYVMFSSIYNNHYSFCQILISILYFEIGYLVTKRMNI